MKNKLIIGVIVWNLLLTVAVISCVYSLKNHLAAIVKTVDNVSELIKITKNVTAKQEEFAEFVKSVKGLKIWNRILSPDESKGLSKIYAEPHSIGSQTTKTKLKDISVMDYEDILPFKIYPTERK